MEGVGFTAVEEVVLQGQPGVVSHVAPLPSDILLVGGDGALDP
jgi:hypothetical protein